MDDKTPQTAKEMLDEFNKWAEDNLDGEVVIVKKPNRKQRRGKLTRAEKMAKKRSWYNRRKDD